jgi:hypothetical protein
MMGGLWRRRRRTCLRVKRRRRRGTRSGSPWFPVTASVMGWGMRTIWMPSVVTLWTPRPTRWRERSLTTRRLRWPGGSR